MMELNLAMPMMSDCLNESIMIIGNAADIFAEDCVKGLKANKKAIASTVERSLMLGTALAPVIGYNEAARIAKECYRTGQTIRDYCIEHKVLPVDQLDDVLDVSGMTHPH